MTRPSLDMRTLAANLLAFESRNAPPTETHLDHVIRVFDRLRVPFSKLAGDAGFSSFLSRAFVLAKIQEPLLRGIRIEQEGTLMKFACEDPSHSTGEKNPGLALVSQLLNLLVIFIGEPLTVTLVSDAWPDESFDRMNVSAEEMP